MSLNLAEQIDLRLQQTARKIEMITAGPALANSRRSGLLADADLLVSLANEFQTLTVAKARLSGMTWQGIADQYDMTKQGAQQRWGHLVPQTGTAWDRV